MSKFNEHNQPEIDWDLVIENLKDPKQRGLTSLALHMMEIDGVLVPDHVDEAWMEMTIAVSPDYLK